MRPTRTVRRELGTASSTKGYEIARSVTSKGLLFGLTAEKPRPAAAIRLENVLLAASFVVLDRGDSHYDYPVNNI